jgi:hypothetical protein
MGKKPRKKKRDSGFAVTAFRVVQEATKKPEPEEAPAIPEGKNPHAVALGRLGGLKGGKARTAKMTMEERQALAKKAAQQRWHPQHLG